MALAGSKADRISEISYRGGIVPEGQVKFAAILVSLPELRIFSNGFAENLDCAVDPSR